MSRKKNQNNAGERKLKVNQKMWTNLEQLEYLWARLSTYQEHQANRTTVEFWPPLFEDWFERWPLGKDVSEDAEGVEKPVRRRLKQWFNNHSRGGKSRASGGAKVLDLSGRSTRRRLAAYQT
ncbi:hypothetical protein FA95DRAFT_1612678 [Auriscalpium vulgare]|uniref:Uncharacterized protein n=1 Tax=Auriscalpium vulgare TaxID=40419 RepID=A0ACB8R5D8_9AGAM|nr:hypothetical protein FA95DRAFT_1612678 [Auriscalpium vulgare]